MVVWTYFYLERFWAKWIKIWPVKTYLILDLLKVFLFSLPGGGIHFKRTVPFQGTCFQPSSNGLKYLHTFNNGPWEFWMVDRPTWSILNFGFTPPATRILYPKKMMHVMIDGPCFEKIIIQLQRVSCKRARMTLPLQKTEGHDLYDYLETSHCSCNCLS